MNNAQKSELELRQVQNQIAALKTRADQLKDYINDLRSREARPFIDGFMPDDQLFEILFKAKPEQGSIGLFKTEDGKAFWISHEGPHGISDNLCVYQIRPRPKEHEGLPAPVICRITFTDMHMAAVELGMEINKLFEKSMIEIVMCVLAYRIRTGVMPVATNPEPEEEMEEKRILDL